MLGDVENYPEGKSAEICKPDYEQLIKAQNEQLEKTVNLKHALFGYIGMRGHVHDKLAELLGELVQEERVIGYRINKLIERQTKSQD